MIDWKSKEKLECRECSETIDIQGLATTAIKQKLKQKNWSCVIPSPACPKHYYKNKQVDA